MKPGEWPFCWLGWHVYGPPFSRMETPDSYTTWKRCRSCGRLKQVMSDRGTELDEWGQPLQWPPLGPPERKKQKFIK